MPCTLFLCLNILLFVQQICSTTISCGILRYAPQPLPTRPRTNSQRCVRNTVLSGFRIGAVNVENDRFVCAILAG